MAAEVPVGDVLCEAMEYLSKLGSNLRTRSENLKEKKIRRDKLKNTHAVQKAANKVLLICELSKKSLENVESGVRKILSLVDASQQSVTNDGGKISNSNHSSITRPVYQYFEYRSRKLRTSKKVPIKHYMSVKVLARNMPIPMLEKYPVYYNCKLYRNRREALEKLQKDKSSKKVHEDNSLIGNSTLTSCEDYNIVENYDSTKPETRNVSETKNDDFESKGNKHEETAQTSKEGIARRNHERTQNSEPNESIFANEDDEVLNNKYIHQSKKDNRRVSISSQHEHRTDKEETQRKRNKVLRTVDIAYKSNDSGNEINNDVNIISDEEIITSNQHKGSPPKSRKKKNIESDSESATKQTHEMSVIELGNAENKPDKKKLEEHQNTLELTADPTSDDNQNDMNNESHEVNKKPLIKCVNINKLLKPDVVDNIINEPKQIKKHKSLKDNDEKSNNLHNSGSNKHNKDREFQKAFRDQKEDKYWTQKRKEVCSFNPKKFVIKITRLPTLSKNFLHMHNLKKITNYGSGELCNSNLDCENMDTEKVKNSLLNDSDSDCTNQQCNSTIEAGKVKNALLNESDSDHSETGSNCNPIRQENSLKSNCGENTCPKKLRTETQEAKNTLLNESDSDSKNKDETKKTIQKPIVKNVKDNHLNSIDSSKHFLKENKNQIIDEYDDVNSNKMCNSVTGNGKNANLFKNDNKCVKNNLNKSSEQINRPLNENDDNNSSKEINDLAKQVKNSLLDDSDSDKNQSTWDKNNKNLNISNNKHTNDPNGGSDIVKSHMTYNLNKGEKMTAKKSYLKEQDDASDKELSTTSDKIKSSLLNFSDDNQKTPDNDGKRIKLGSTPQSKKKRVRESMKAKKGLLIYSSSSDDEQSKNDRLKGIKNLLLKGSSDDEDSPKKLYKRRRKKIRLTSSSSSEAEGPKKNNTRRSSNSRSDVEKQVEPNKDPKKISKNEGTKDSDINQVDGTIDERSNSSTCKMVRSKAKPGNSGNQSSNSQDDDKDIDRLTNLNSLDKPHRRKESSAKVRTEDTSPKRNSRMPKPSVIGEDLLKSESSSDAASDGVAGDDADETEELPPVSLSDINNGIGCVSKDDLLGESDSSVSHNEKERSSEDVPEVDESDEENVKLRRRKANAISSDSEAGLSRKKDRDVRMSDFEDSEGSPEPGKKSKRKKASDSDASDGSSNSSKKKRRRIKQLDSDASDSDGENEGRNKHGRKNIRKVMGKNQLEEATKKAAREEKERIARIAERQKLYNNLEFDESGKPDEVVLDKVVLDFDPETKEPLIEVDRGLVKKLKPHQANGIKFMWNACFESVKRIKKDKGSGCILAHCMGLGKTLQVISLTHTLLTHSALTGVRRVLVVCPLSTVLNWVSEVRMWLRYADTDYEVDVYELSRYKQNSERAYQLNQWFEGGGVCVLGYEMFRNLSADNNKKYKKKILKQFQESLVDPGPDLVVCDEGHLLKNEKTSLSQSMNRVKTRRRIVLTGTPLQNNLKEYYCMVQFVKPNLLGKYNEYLNRFVNPITNGQYTDSTEQDIRVMKRRSHVLHKMLDGAVQRRDYGVLAPFLPPKHEYVLFITLSEVQIKLYQFYLDNYSRRPLAGKSSGFLFPDFQSLQRIWTHPLVLKYNSERYEVMQQKKREREEEDSEGSLVDFIDDDSTPDETSTEESSDDLSDDSDDSRKKSKKKKSAKKSKSKDSKVSGRRGTRANPIEQAEEELESPEVLEVKNENPTEWWIKLVTDEELEDVRNSHKLVLLFDILRQCETIGDKLLVFSQSLYSLDLIEHFLGKVDEATQEGRIDEKLGRHVGSWSPGVDYFRLDGSTSCENRSIWCKNFNREDNPRARLFLISTRAGGLGINLVAANRVVIFDVSWNPSHDVQSIFRVYRFGQKKPCYVYRFLAMGTMEEKIYERQVTKQAISKRVIDEQQIDRHYAENDLAELYKFSPTPDAPRELPPLPRDRLFAEMLREHEAQIFKYHEHDSLLENKEEETLTEEERKAAWEDFENEKNKPPPAPFPSAWPSHNGMMPGQMAYAVLAAMVRQDRPNLGENEVRGIVANLYNSNPGMFSGYDYGLFQKISEMYNYTQPGMMNLPMMNAAMNPAAGSAMGGTSGLQYEPPWQRQQQQQQQLRLQQLMQQQNAMGAKYYAGGLGSRDPMAMMMQQQRAREMMLGGSGGAAAGGGAGAAPGGGAGRPRGRPPSVPRPLVLPPAPTAAQDVVNLDSD